eukprot:TRINITY_DN25685_c0_g1_i2.p1 TRINITY_DN25685_c0_g1~~TRINITY_DN25685_c0_g1_i2.p1  ORF type:complete len:515 (+),score=114.98 TRINITY_DN25685_c0_g1_i2:237-1781(+)
MSRATSCPTISTFSGGFGSAYADGAGAAATSVSGGSASSASGGGALGSSATAVDARSGCCLPSLVGTDTSPRTSAQLPLLPPPGAPGVVSSAAPPPPNGPPPSAGAAQRGMTGYNAAAAASQMLPQGLFPDVVASKQPPKQKRSMSNGACELPSEAQTSTPTASTSPAGAAATGAGAQAGSDAKSGPSKAKSRFRAGLGALKIDTKKDEAPKEKKPEMFRLLQSGERASDFYDFGGELDKSGGVGGRVLEAKRRADGREVIVKIRDKQSHKRGERGWRAMMAEFARLRGCPNVLDLDEILEDEEAFYIVMPKCDGGELFDFLSTAAEIPEAECQRIIREILLALRHLHANDIIHRDIKPENILFDQALDPKDPESPKTVKLIDFDTCANWVPNSPKTKSFVGTPGYIAPEVLMGDACPQSDLWSVGVILYVLMTGLEPWADVDCHQIDGTVNSASARQMYEFMRHTPLDWEMEPWPEFPLARELCQKLLAFDTEHRPPTVTEALAHPWLAATAQ